jgi:transposase-like protein
LAKLKRLATREDAIVDVVVPVTDEELKDRQKQYDLLEPKKFATRYNDMLYRPVSFKRLIQIETVQDIEPEYNFHKDNCPNSGISPFEVKKLFYKQGKSTAGSQRWQCKSCKKITNVLPTRKQSTTYNQKRNDVLPMFAKLLVNKVPINRACDILEIGSGTYYDKLEWLYRRCIEYFSFGYSLRLGEII